MVNALGAIIDRAGNVVRGNRTEPGTRLSYLEVVERGLATEPARGENTTLTLIVTNQQIRGRQLQQFARQVHVSMARAIQPFHTEFDGDVLFAVSTNEVNHAPLATASALGALASEAAWDAVLASFDPE